MKNINKDKLINIKSSAGSSMKINKEDKNEVLLSQNPLTRVRKLSRPQKHLNNNIFSSMEQPLTNVRFVINDKEFVTAFRIATPIAFVKANLANVLQVEETSFSLETDGVHAKDSSTLADIGALANSFTFHIVPKYNEENKIIAKVEENLPTLNEMTVHLSEGANAQQDLVVNISKQCLNKEWLGGYRNRLTNVEYHNAIAQTDPNLKIVDESLSSNPAMFHRDTQTPFLPSVDVTTSTFYNQATQTYRSDLYIDPINDQIITAGTYVPQNVTCKLNEVVQAVVFIQRSVKRWLHYKRLSRLKEYTEKISADIQQQKREILAEEARKEREIITGAVFPVKRDDFYMLYLMVGNWWKDEWRKICDFSEESKKAQAVQLLLKEIQLLKEIERQRIESKKETQKKDNVSFLDQTSSPLVFINANGNMFSIDNLQTQKAREFKDMYCELIRTNNSPKERIDFLLTLKQLFLSNFVAYEYSKDLVTLLDREIELLTRGAKYKDLSGLRKRIEQLYLYLLHQKDFNPRSVKYMERNIPKTMKILFKCKRCLKLLPASKYPVHVRMKVYDMCTSCTWLKNIGFNRVDMTPYVKLLNAVRNAEMEKCCYEALCFILQPIGMCHLTNTIWHGRSAISECSDITKLQHVRWLSHVEWSPWNTILLSNQEAEYHKSIQQVFQFYQESFIKKVKQKHILARICFQPLLEMNHDVCSSGEWVKSRDSEVNLHPNNVSEFNST